ncbi:hypothetical protein C8R44DRAFT_637955 [Mycena epipterygia]|nr:hypothetical protein C8R44DRAFT_637955 [Mycena epipterygia]
MFTQIIKSLRDRPTRKSTTYNLDRIRCCISETFGYQPPDAAIWTSIRSTNIHRLTRNFLWKCMRDTYHVGMFWERVQNLEALGQCSTCRMTESMEHIMLECNAPGQQQVWRLVEELWKLRYPNCPALNWGLLLGCGLARSKFYRGKLIPAKNRFFTMIFHQCI